MSAVDITAKTNQTYDRIAADYASRWSDLVLEDQLTQFSHYVKSGSLVLELGCGPGRDIQHLSERGYQVIGLDRSGGMLKEASNRKVGPLVQADMRHLPFAAESFGGVWSSAAMLHLPKSDLPQTLAETHRVLDHGQLYLAVKEGQAETWEGDPAHGQRFFAYYQPAEVELALERADFHVLWQMLSPDQRGYNWINMIVWKKLPKVAAAANALIFNEQAQILLTRRADNGWWCIPGGHLDPNETIEAAAVREALEETGLTVTIEQVTGMYNVTYPAALMPEKKPRHIFVIAYRCRVLSGSLTLNDEVTEFGWFAPEHLPTDMMPHHAARVQDAIKKQ